VPVLNVFLFHYTARLRIPDHQVGIAAGSNAVFPLQAKEVRRVFSNRRHFDERLAAELAFARRHETDLALVLLDVDHFKRINDSLGHATGDVILAEVATRLQRTLRGEDLVARFGGEEFAVVLRSEGIEQAMQVADRLRSCVSERAYAVAERPVEVTISGGCACLTEGEATAAALLGAADRRLYLAKSAGRNRIVGKG
jgi:diguanylate cyclase (GGDEF)-like protein